MGVVRFPAKNIVRRDSAQFAEVCGELLEAGLGVRFTASGESMQPNISHGDQVVVMRATDGEVKPGQVVLAESSDGLRVHRVVRKLADSGRAIMRGDAGQENDAAASRIFGRVTEVVRDGNAVSLSKPGTAWLHASRRWAHRLRRAAEVRLKRAGVFLLPALIFALGSLAWQAAPAIGQTLTLTDTAAPTMVAPGGTITYTLVLTNTGTVAVTHPLTVTENLPAQTNFGTAAKSAGNDNWTCAAAGQVVTCTDTSGGTYAAGDSTTFKITATVSSSPAPANGTVLTDAASAQGNNPVTANAPATSVTVQTPDLSMTQTESPSPVATGGDITYTETVTNNSAEAGIGATLTQSTPTNTTFVSAAAPTGWTCGTVPAVGGTGTITCTATGSVAANSTTGNFSIVVLVNAGVTVGSTITNTATVSETGTDPVPANNTTTTSVTVSGADLAMTQTASAAASAPGSTITYTETVTNNGPNAAVGATLYQQTPPNTTFSSITAPTGWACGTTPAAGGTGSVICTASANVASGTTSGAFTYVVKIGAGTAAGTTILNWADVTSQTTDSNASNNATTTSVLVEVTGDADLALSTTVVPTPVFISSTITYTIQLTNLGLAAGTAVTVTDTYPTALASPSATSTQGSCAAPSGGQIVCTIGAVNYPLATPITITLTGMTPATATTLTNTAVAATTATDPVSANNTSTVMTVVQPLVCATPGKDGAPGTLTGTVNTYYAGVGTAAAGTNTLTVTTPSSGAATQVGVGDLLLVMQMQGAQLNVTNTSAYGDGVAGNPASGATSLGNSGQFEFVTVTAITTGTNTDTVTIAGTGAGGGLLNSYASVAASNTSVPPQGAQTFQVIRVPQYTSATLSSTLAAPAWNGAVGGVLALDVASQLTLGGSVSMDGQGFRGGGGLILGGGAGAATDVVTLSTVATNASKGEGIAGTPHYVAPPLSAITLATTATSTAQTYLEGYPSGSFARGAPGNAGGGATDADPAANDQNSGGGAGGNGGTGGAGGFGWSSAGLVGGFGGVAFPASTSSVILGGGGGAGTTNNGTAWNPVTQTGPANNCGANCTGIYSSGTAGGGIVVIRAGSVTGTGTITASGQNALDTENDGGGGGGAGGSIVVQANSGGLTGLTANAVGGNGGHTWPEDAPGGSFPGNRHGPGGGGGGGVVFTSSAAGTVSVAPGIPGTTTLANDAYGATIGQTGLTASGVTITQTPGTQSGAFCAGADLNVSNIETPNPVAPGGTITYTQGVGNAGPFDALNAVFSEAIPNNTTFSSITPPTGWACNSTASILSTGLVTCTNADFASRALGSFSLAVTVNAGTQFGTQIVDVANITSGTTDPNLTNNTATATTVVGTTTSAYLTLTKVAAAPTVSAGNNITYTMVVTNNGPAAAPSVAITDTTPTGTTFVSASGTGFGCSGLAAGGAGTETCTLAASLASGSTATLTLVVKVNATGVSNGTLIVNTASANSSVANPNPGGATASATVTVASATQADLAITSSATPNPVYNYGSTNVTFTQVVTNNGPLAFTAGAPATYVDTLPSNATFVSLTAPTGWTCGAPVTVGATTTVTCTGPLAVGAMAMFPLVEQITAADTAGTAITNSAMIGPTATDPNTANNTASSTTYVAAPSQADLSIVKTASPEPVDQGANLTYTLQVTNNGPAVAQNISVADTLPAQVTFTNVFATQGSCTQSGGAVGCTIPSLSVGGVAIITINVVASTFSGSGGTVCDTANGISYSVCNTATVLSATTSDPDLSNNTSTADSTIQSVTAVQLASFRAFLRGQGGVLLEWHTQEEIRNLGFNVYRTDAQGRHQVNPSLIAGAALLVRGGQPQHGAKTYYWIDPAGDANSSYELQDVDLNGTRTTHGPAMPEASGQPSHALAAASPSADVAAGSAATTASGAAAPQMASAAGAQRARQVSNAPLLTDLNRLAATSASLSAAISAPPAAAAVATSFVPQRALRVARPALPTLAPGQYRVSQDLQTALKIGVTDEGWYSITHEQMTAAGFNPGFEPQNLQLYAEGVEQPMLVVWRPGSRIRPFLGIEFYGTGIDTPFSGTRVYWLVRGVQAGKRVTEVSSPTFGSSSARDFLATVVEEDRTTYFPTLLNGENNDNFFGAAVTSEPVDQQLTIAHLNPNSALSASVEITLQGGTDQQAHSVAVSFNGAPIGEMDFLNQCNVTNNFPINASLLQEGVNTVTLTALDGDNDVSLVQSMALHYPHTFAADGDWLKATATPGANLNVTGFANAQISAFDISDPLNIVQLEGNVEPQGNSYAIALAVPNTGVTQHTLLIFSSAQISAPASLTLHLADPAIHRQQTSDIVIISHPDFVSSIAPLAALHQSQGRQVTVVTTDQIYDAFNYGERTPLAIQNYLQQLSAEPALAPRAVLLVGDASLDPRNYLGFGDFDFVPTRIIETQAFKTASDDWFSDFQQTGYGTIPIGRIPVRTAADAALVIGKIVGYESGSSAGPWNQQAVLVADQNSDTNFTNEAAFASPDVPNSLQQTQILTGNLEVNTARQQILEAINNGALLVNYTGHGATEQWSFADLLDDDSAATLSNGDRLPFFLLMDCLNGFFHDVYTESLAESLLLAPNGGAVAVWASSGFTSAPPQATMDQALLHILQNDSATSIGQAALNAKLGISDPDVRRTWILFGDPAMQLQLPRSSTAPAASTGARAREQISQGPRDRQ